MNVFIWILMAAGGLAVASQLSKRKKFRAIAELPDTDFITAYRKRFAAEEADIIRERRFIANMLGIDPFKITPDQAFAELEPLTGFLTEYHIGMSDLEAEMVKRYQQSGLQIPKMFPPTVGDLIHSLLTAKKSEQ
ncbi:MAG TPA: hypothetical protein VJ023_18030 [Pyrinomonadaceae bacterium]|nr:hypothetical protein [Pyrinomonadaceae bacterium]